MSFESSSRRARYSPEFKLNVLEKLNTGDRTLKQVAEEFGVSRVSLIKWRQEHQRGAAKLQREREIPAPGDDNELIRLRLEVAALREERDRLRRSIACLVGMS